MPKRLPRPPFQRELRNLLNHKDGVSAAGGARLPLPLLRAALEARGLLTPGESFADAACLALKDLIPVLPDAADDVKAALLIHFCIDPEFVTVDGRRTALTQLTAAGRREAAWVRAGLTRDMYDHDRDGRPPGPLTCALGELEALLNGSPPRTKGKPSGSALARVQHASDFDRAWSLLNQCRTIGASRYVNLAELLPLVDLLTETTKLDEARALAELVRYEQNRGLEVYRLVQGLKLLENALAAYKTSSDVELSSRLSQQLLSEYAQVFLTGDQVPGGRSGYLDRLEAVAEELIELYVGQPLEQARSRVSLGEALKERAQVTHDTAAQQELCRRSREECQQAIRLVDGAATEDPDDRARIRAAAKRHAAITYEMEADKALSHEPRRQSLEKWLQLSEEAAAEAEDRDDFIRGYALMNAASAHSRLADLETSSIRKRERLDDALPHLEESERLVESLADARGQGWINIHWCDNHNRRADLATDQDERVILLREFETRANRALVHLKPLEDELGLVFAYLQLGRALYRLYSETDADSASPIRLERATSVLTLAHERTKEIGFHRESLSAARMLASCRYDTWTATPTDTTLLVSAIEAQITGLCEMYSGQGAEEELRSLYVELDRTLHARLDE